MEEQGAAASNQTDRKPINFLEKNRAALKNPNIHDASENKENEVKAEGAVCFDTSEGSKTTGARKKKSSGESVPSTGGARARPSTSGLRPSTASSRPSSASAKPLTAGRRPSTATGTRSSTGGAKPSTASTRPATASTRTVPATTRSSHSSSKTCAEAKRPVTASVRPSTAGARPSATGKRPTAVGVRPSSASAAGSQSSRRINNQHTASTTTEKKKVKNEDKPDLITKLADRNLLQIVEDIFLYLTPLELASSRCVSRRWRSHVRCLWQSGSSRKHLNRKLGEMWRKGQHSRIDLSLSGYECRNQCQLNSRDCDCKPMALISGGSLVFQWGTSSVKGTRRVNNGVKNSIEHQFDRDQYQIRFSLNENLELETSTYLSSPIFWKPQAFKEKLKFRGYLVQPTEDRMRLTISKEGTSREVAPSIGYGNSRRIDKMMPCAGRLAILMEGRVYVYSLATLVDETKEPADALVLLGTRMHQSNVIYFYLLPDKLITVAENCDVTMFTFWRSSDVSRSEYFT